MPTIQYLEAINQGLHQIMEADRRAFLIGQGITSPWYVGGTTGGLMDRFGPERVIDTPVSENGMTGVAVGAALAGMRPVLVFPRLDFMHYAMDQIANHAANWHYMFGGQCSVPLTIWAIVNRGGQQAAQHAHSLQAMFCHLPGLKVVMPSTPYDAKGLLFASVEDDNPVVFIDDRWLYNEVGDVPNECYSVPLGKGAVRRRGADLTVAATSYLAVEAEKAAVSLAKDGIDAEVLDLRSLKPLDEELVCQSVSKTGRLLVVDGGWRTCGVAAEVCTLIVEKSFGYLKAPPARVTLPDAPAPASPPLEKVYYPDAVSIASAANTLMKWST